MNLRRPMTLGLALLTSLALSGCDRAPGGADATATPGGTAAPRPTVRRAVDNVVTADGQLVLPLPPQPLSFATAGEVLAVKVVDGQTVRAGDVLATVDAAPADLSVAQAQAALTQAEAALAKLERGTGVESARIEVERAKNSLWGQQSQRDAICGQADADCDSDNPLEEAACKANREGAKTGCNQAQASVQALEQGVLLAQQNLESAQANLPGDVASARAQVTQARLALERARDERGRTQLTAPFDGVVSQLNVTPGVRVAPGSPVLTLVKTRPLRFATTNLGERNVGDIEPGAPATVTLTTFPDQPLEGIVQRVAPQAATDESGLTTFAVYIDVDPGDLPLRAGMTGRAEIRVGAP